MIHYGEGARHRPVGMDPQGVVRWNMYNDVADNTRLCADPYMDRGILTALVSVAITGPTGVRGLELIDSGKLANIYKFGGYVIKRSQNLQQFTKDYYMEADQAAGLSCVKANITLSQGLQNVNPLTIMEGRKKRTVTYHTPTYFGYASADTADYPDARPTILMSYEKGTVATEEKLPDEWERLGYLEGALRAAGLAPRAVNLDDCPQNTLIAGRNQYVKLDVMANRQLDFPIPH